MQKYYTVRTLNCDGREIWLHKSEVFGSDAAWNYAPPRTPDNLFLTRNSVQNLLDNPGFINTLYTGIPEPYVSIEWYEVQIKVEYTRI